MNGLSVNGGPTARGDPQAEPPQERTVAAAQLPPPDSAMGTQPIPTSTRDSPTPPDPSDNDVVGPDDSPANNVDASGSSDVNSATIHDVAAAATEHPAIRDSIAECARLGAEPRQLAVDRNGLVDLDALEHFLKAEGDRCALISVMWANNETGVIQPIERIGALCRDAGVLLHTDAVQWVGRMPCAFATLPIDLLSCSAHKFHGPKGAGALVIRRGVRITPRSLGGSQERERRGGTENVPAIAGMGVACELARTWLKLDAIEQMAALRDSLEQGLEEALGHMVVHGRDVPRLWNTSNIAFPGTESQLMVVVLSERGLAVSGGAACASGSIQPSGVLLAMGLDPELAGSSLRLSLNRSSTPEMIQSATEILTSALRAAQET